jgi:eukaryotic-like serine/threonine-protein kinase
MVRPRVGSTPGTVCCNSVWGPFQDVRGVAMDSHSDPQSMVSLPERFRSLWEAGGSIPDVLAFLASHAEASSNERLEIILVDQEYRSSRGRGLSISDYLAAAPDFACRPEILAQLTKGESQAPGIEANPEASKTTDWPMNVSQVGLAVGTTLDEQTTQVDTEAGQTTQSATREVPEKTLPVETELLTTADTIRLASDAMVAFKPSAEIDLEKSDDGTQTIGSMARFTIQERLGGGGMGVVYRAFDRERGETIALKTMRRVDPMALYRFKNEFRTLADLTHQNLVNLFELIAVGDLWFFTMELIEGLDFISFVRQELMQPDRSEATAQGKLDGQRLKATEAGEAAAPAREPRAGGLSPAMVDRLRGALRQLAEGLYALHQVGKLHRDVKPSNVLVTGEGRVVLLDFGLAADLERSGSLSNTEGQIVGTISYMSPEQAGGLPVSPASDWYSVGVMLYEAQTGRLPHQGSIAQILRKKTTVDPPPPSVLVEGVPEDLSQLCMDLLDRVPENRPSGDEVLSRLLASPRRWGVAPMPCQSTHLIGRGSHLEALRSALTIVKSGEPLALFISGRSGSGKSTLVQSFLEEISTSDDVVVLTGRCYERESVPYKALDSLLDALSRYLKQLPAEAARGLLPDDVSLLARLFPVLQRVEVVAESPRPVFEGPDQFELRRRASTALRQLLTRMVKEHTLVLAIDDLQWGDIDSAMLLLDLMRPPQPPALLLLGSYRSEEVERSPFLQAIKSLGAGELATPWRRELAVEALTIAESRELAQELLSQDNAMSRARAHIIATESQGNPLFIYELVDYVRSGTGLAESPASTGQIDLDAVLWSRIERLPERARWLLETVAVSGQPIAQAAAIEASELGPEAHAAVMELRGSRLIRVSGPSPRDEIEVYHDQIRETIVGHLAPVEVQERHRRLALVLESTGHADLEQLAVHFEGAGDRDRAGTCYAKAADLAARALAFMHAAKLYRKAIEFRSGASEQDTGQLWASLGDALANAGRGQEAAQAYFAATSLVDAVQALELHRRATMQLLISGHVDEGLEALRNVLRPMGMTLPSTPRRALLSLLARRVILRFRGLGFVPRDESQISAEDLTRIDLCWSAVAGLSIIDPIMGADFQARGLLRALRAGEPYRIARALAMEAAHVSTAGGPGRRNYERLLSMAEPLAESVGQPHAKAMITLARALGLLMFGEWKTACTWFDRAESLFRSQCTGTAWELDTVHNLCLWGLVHMGDLNTVRRRWPVLLKEARDRGDLYAATTLNTYYMTMLKLADGEDQEPERELDQVMNHWTQRGFHIQHSTAFRARFHLLLYRGDTEGAWKYLRSVWPLYARSLLLRVQMIRVQMHELRARCAVAVAAVSEEPRRLLRQAEHDVNQLEHEQRPWALAYARCLQAAIAVQRRQHDKARERLQEAVDRFAACDMLLNAAVARRRLGEMIGGVEGDSLVAQANAWIGTQGIRDPARWTAMYAPGFATSKS